MTEETYDRAVEIKEEIEKLETELKYIPYSSIFSSYKKLFYKYNFRENYGINCFQLTNDDFFALRKVRLEKIKALEEELEEL